MSDKPHVYERDGKIIYRASALGGSFRCLVAARLGYEPMPTPSKMLEVFEAGHNAEKTALKTLENDGEWFVYSRDLDGRQLEVALKITEKIWVVGHIDGKALKTDEKYKEVKDQRVVEVKSQSQGEWNAYTDDWSHGLWPRYRWQVSTYMHAEGLPLLLVRFNRDSEELAVSYVDEPFYSIPEVRRRVLAIEAQAATGELPSDSCSDYPCPFFYCHEDERVELEDPQIEVLAREYKAAQRDEKAAKEKKKVTFAALKIAAGDKRKLRTENDWKVTFFDARNAQKSLCPYPGIETLAAALGLSIVEPFKRPTYGERVRITPPKEDAND